MSIAFQAPIFFGSGTGLLSESSGTASQRQFHQERPSLRLQKHSKVVRLQARGAVYICNGGRRKFDGKGTSVGRISQLLRFAQPPHSSDSFGKKIGPAFTSLHGALRATRRQNDRVTGASQ